MARKIRHSGERSVMGELKKIEKEEKVIEKEEKFLENRQTVIAALEQIGIMRWRSYYLLTAGAVLLMALTFGLGIVAVNNNVQTLQSSVNMLNNRVALIQAGPATPGAVEGAIGLPIMQYLAPTGCTPAACDTTVAKRVANAYGYNFDQYETTYIGSPVLIMVTADKKVALADPTSEKETMKALCGVTNDNAICAISDAMNVVDVTFDETDPVKGSATAPVTIVEFSEYLCPFCKRFAEGQMQQIITDYVNTDKVKIVFRDYIVHGETAQKIAEAAQCANDQGKFWEMHDALFADQSSLSSVDKAKEIATGLGLNMADFNSCLDSGKYTQEVQTDSADGKSYGVSGTPSFFINGELIVGAQPYETFKAAIDKALGEQAE